MVLQRGRLRGRAGLFRPLGTADARTFRNDALPAGQSLYRIRAHRRGLASPWSPMVAVNIGAAPSAGSDAAPQSTPQIAPQTAPPSRPAADEMPTLAA